MQVNVPPLNTAAALLPALGTHAPTVTGIILPRLSTAVAVQVAFAAVFGPALVHTIWPFTVAPDALTPGSVSAGLISLIAGVTVNAAFTGNPLKPTGPDAVGAPVVLVIAPAVLDVTFTRT